MSALGIEDRNWIWVSYLDRPWAPASQHSVGVHTGSGAADLIYENTTDEPVKITVVHPGPAGAILVLKSNNSSEAIGIRLQENENRDVILLPSQRLYGKAITNDITAVVVAYSAK